MVLDIQLLPELPVLTLQFTRINFGKDFELLLIASKKANSEKLEFAF
jgi:hypothetical protein